MYLTDINLRDEDWSDVCIQLKPFSAKPIFGEKKRKENFFFFFIATSDFMLERKILSSFFQPTDRTFSQNREKK